MLTTAMTECQKGITVVLVTCVLTAGCMTSLLLHDHGNKGHRFNKFGVRAYILEPC